MGKLIKNHWARLVIIVASLIQIGGAIEGLFWPKVTWDFCTSSLNSLVAPFPFLQIANMILGLLVLSWEWPICFIAGGRLHRSIHARFIVFAVCSLVSLFLYESHNAVLYYTMGSYGYWLALVGREVI